MFHLLLLTVALLLLGAIVAYKWTAYICGNKRRHHPDASLVDDIPQTVSDPTEWGPGCHPRWCNTAQFRLVEREGKSVLQEKYVFQGYAGANRSSVEWRDVTLITED